jgi:hypothetical protein
MWRKAEAVWLLEGVGAQSAASLFIVGGLSRAQRVCTRPRRVTRPRALAG